MTTVTQKRLISGSQLTASTVTYYTVPASTTTTIFKLTLINTTGTARTVDLHLVPALGSADATNQILDAYSLPANMTESYEVTAAVGHVMEASATIQAVADVTTAVTIMASGQEIS